jgi:hypothetical protein
MAEERMRSPPPDHAPRASRRLGRQLKTESRCAGKSPGACLAVTTQRRLAVQTLMIEREQRRAVLGSDRDGIRYPSFIFCSTHFLTARYFACLPNSARQMLIACVVDIFF